MNDQGTTPGTPPSNVMATPSVSAAVPPPLTNEQMIELENGRRRWKKIQRAVRTAKFSAWTMAIIAAPTLLYGIFDRTSAIMGLLLMGIAVNEFIGAGKLKKAQYVAPMLLGWNQLLLLAVIGGYCFYNIFLVAHQLSADEQQLQALMADPSVQQMLGPSLADLAANPRGASDFVYVVLAFATLLTQGLTALYYFTRRKHVLAYLNATPAWVVEVQRRSAA